MDLFVPITSEEKKVRLKENPRRSVCIFKGMGKGKTTELIKLAIQNQGVVVVQSLTLARQLRGKDTKLEPYIFSISEVRGGALRNLNVGPVYIDEVGHLVQDYLGVYPTGISFTNLQD